VGDSCSLTTDCSSVITQSSCTSGHCQCNVGYYATTSLASCVARVIGDQCSVDIDCSTVITPSAFCNPVSHVCQCVSGYVPSPGGASCRILLVGVGTCSSDADCLVAIGPHSQCSISSGLCQCVVGYEPNPPTGGTKCQLMSIGSVCVTNDQCFTAVSGSLCISGACRCPTNAYLSQSSTSYVCLLGKFAVTFIYFPLNQFYLNTTS
jgi:hypothetical protein